MRRALITGIAGQDGSYLADLLLEEGLEVHGTVRPGGRDALWRLEGTLGRLVLHPVELLDERAVADLVDRVAPDECYHLTGTRKPLADAREEAEAVEGAIGTTHALLAALHETRPDAAFLFAASSEMFAPDAPAPQDEATPLAPGTPYAIAKAAGLHLARYFRETKGLRACAAILFNHESPRRGPEFVTRKIAAAAARIKLGLASQLTLGDLSASRDWGHARSFARGMRLMLRQARPEELVLATGRAHTVGDFVAAAFGHLGLDWRDHVVVDPAIPRPTRAGLVGNPARALDRLGWRDDVPFERLVAEMTDAELRRAAEDHHPPRQDPPDDLGAARPRPPRP